MATVMRFAIALLILAGTVPPASGQEISLIDPPPLAPRLLDRPAGLKVTARPLADALMRLQMASGVPLAFSPTLLRGHQTSCECLGVTVGEALDRMLEATSFRYAELAGQVVISRIDGESPPDPVPAQRGAVRLATAAEIGSIDPPTLPRPRLQGAVACRVTDATTQQPLQGVQVYIEGTSIADLTDPSGRYRLANVPAGEVEVRAEILGYEAQDHTVNVPEGGTATLNFQLSAAAIELEAIVASVEAGAVRRKELGTDIARIPVEDEIATAAVENFSDLLNSRAANVQITPSSGLLGSGSKIRIRGFNSLTQDNNPLIIIDGVRVSNSTELGPISTGGQTGSRFDDINPSEISDIQVIKGPSATALYGSEAAAGVIVINTKTGQAGQEQFTMSVNTGVAQNPADFPDTYMNVTPFYGITSVNDPRLEQFRAVEHPLTGDVFVLDNPLSDPDSDPFRNGWFSEYDVSYRGGTEAVTYYTSLNYQDRNGTVAANELDRLTWRGNAQLKPRSDVDLAVSAGYINSARRFPDDNSTGSGLGVGGLLGTPLASFGTDPALGPGQGICLENALLGQPAGTSTLCEGRNGTFRTTFDNIMAVDQGEDVTRFITSGEATWRPFDELAVSATAGVDDTERRVYDITPFDPDLPLGSASLGLITDFRQLSRIVTADSRATLSLDVSDRVSSHTTAGTQYFATRVESVTCTGERFPSDDVRSCGAAQVSRGFSDLLENVEMGAFLQERIGYNDYLFVTGAMRVDDNSALGDRAEAIWSPSANASLVLSDMPFWRVDWVDDLRLRFAWGKASQSPRPFQADRTFQSASLLLDGSLVTGASPLDPGNDLLGPERSEEIEAGFDATALDNRIALSLTYFDSETEDLIVPAPVAPSTGFPGLQFVNLGSMKNSGVEVNLEAEVLRSEDFTWDVRFQHSTTDPIITDLGLPAPIIFPVGAEGGSRAAGSQALQTGFAPGVYISPVVSSATRDENGNIVDFELAPGNLGDGSNRRVVGQPFPTNEQSLSSTLTIAGNLRLYALLDRAAGHQMLNVTRAFRSPFIDRPESSSYSREYALRQVLFTPEKQAMIEQQMIGAFVEDADFVKLREVTLTYNLNPSIVQRLFNAASASITVGGRNLATWTEFTGIDPEMNVRGARDEFTANNFAGVFPPMRSFWARVQVAF